MKTVDELWALLREAQQMPYGAAQIALLEQVLRQADASGDRELQYATRILGTTAYVYGGETAKSFVTFSWCLSDFDRDPAPFHRRMQHSLFWHFKYMVTALTKFPEVPLTRTYAVLDDMERRYREAGHSLQAVYKHRYLVAKHVGDEAAADNWYERWNTTPRDALSDCAGCDPSTQVNYLSERGRDEEAVALAEPVLAGRLTCNEQPQTILAALLRPYVRTGRLEAAADAHRRSYRLMRPNLADLWDIGDHIGFCARTGNENRGLEILQRHIDWLDKAPSPAAGMHFAASSALLLRRLSARGHGETTVHRRDRGDVPAAVLADELARHATDLSVRFDARNGTTTQSKLIARTLEAEAYPEFALSPSARRTRGGGPKRNSGQAECMVATTPSDTGCTPGAAAPATALPQDPAALLDLGEELVRQDHEAELRPLLAAFDQLWGSAEPEPPLAARRAYLQTRLLYADGADPEALRSALTLAEQGYRAAGDEARAIRAAAGLGVLHAALGEPDRGLGPVDADVAHQEKHGDARGRALAHSRRGVVLDAASRHDEALAEHEQALAIVRGAGAPEPRLEAKLGLRRAQTLGTLGRHDAAAAAVVPALTVYRVHGPRSRMAFAALLHGQVLTDPVARAGAYDEVLASAEPGFALDARVGRARALLQLERAGEAVDDLVEAVALCTEREIEDGAAFLRQELAQAYQAAGRFVEAAEVAEEAIAALSRLGHDEAAANVRYMLAGIYRELDDNEGALALYEELVAGLADNLAGRGQIRESFGDLLYKLDRDAEAAERFAEAAADLHEIGDLTGEVRLLRRRVMALHWADDVEAAEATIRLAEQRHAELPAAESAEPRRIWERAMLGFEAGRLLNSRARYAEAVPHLAGSAERLRAVGADGNAEQVETLLGQALRGSGRAEESEVLLRRLLDDMDQDAQGRQHAAYQLAETLDALGHGDKAKALRVREGIENS